MGETPQQEVDRLSGELAESRKQFNRVIASPAIEDRATAPKRYWMTTPVHPEKVVDFFLVLHHYWFDESLGPNAFTGMHDDARKYLDVWTETGEFAPDKSTLEIYVRMKFEEWLKSSWTTLAPAASQKRIEALATALTRIAESPEHLGSAFVNDLAVKIAIAALKEDAGYQEVKP